VVTNDIVEKINVKMERQYPVDLPLDVVMSIINFPFITHLGILKIKPIADNNFLIGSLIIDNEQMYQEFYEEMKNILDNKDNDYDVESKKMVGNYLEIINHSMISDKMLMNFNEDEFSKLFIDVPDEEHINIVEDYIDKFISSLESDHLNENLKKHLMECLIGFISS
jgi:hypothetical protein